jgi:beta-galactosidase
MKTTVCRLVILLVIMQLTTMAGRSMAAAHVDIGLNEEWKFIRQDIPDAVATNFDDTSWSSVNLPHTWNNIDGQTSGTPYYRGIGWYRRHLLVDAQYAGKSLFLKFDGAATVTEVLVNGSPVGTHKGNFAAFCFDATPFLKVGQDNVIAVKVSNAKDADVLPLSGDFTVFGGLYRDVHLLVLDQLSVFTSNKQAFPRIPPSWKSPPNCVTQTAPPKLPRSIAQSLTRKGRRSNR